MKKRKSYALLVCLNDGCSDIPYRVFISTKKAAAWCKKFNQENDDLFADYRRIEVL